MSILEKYQCKLEVSSGAENIDGDSVFVFVTFMDKDHLGQRMLFDNANPLPFAKKSFYGLAFFHTNFEAETAIKEYFRRKENGNTSV